MIRRQQGVTKEVGESHLWVVEVVEVLVVLVGRARPWEKQVRVVEEGVGEAEGLPEEQTWAGLKGVLTLVEAPLRCYTTSSQ